jgi:hypothetical protein
LVSRGDDLFFNQRSRLGIGKVAHFQPMGDLRRHERFEFAGEFLDIHG